MGVYEDFMNQATLGGAAQGFIQGMRDGEDRKLRRLEMEAKAEAQDRDRKRQNFMDALEARSKGFKVPEGGNLYDTPASGLEYDPEYLKMKEAQANADPFGLKQLQVKNAGLEGTSKVLEIEKRRKEAAAEAAGKPLTQDKVLYMQEGAQMPKSLDDITTTIDVNSAIFGPIEGRARSMNEYDATAQTVDGQMRVASQNYGKYMEGGVLRKEDEDKYRKMFPKLSDTPAVAKNKLAIVRKNLIDKHNGNIAAFRGQGYSTSGFDPMDSVELPESLTGKTNGKLKTGLVGKQKGLVSGKSAAPAKPQTVIQNGVTYTLNPQTGEYE